MHIKQLDLIDTHSLQRFIKLSFQVFRAVVEIVFTTLMQANSGLGGYLEQGMALTALGFKK